MRGGTRWGLKRQATTTLLPGCRLTHSLTARPRKGAQQETPRQRAAWTRSACIPKDHQHTAVSGRWSHSHPGPHAPTEHVFLLGQGTPGNRAEPRAGKRSLRPAPTQQRGAKGTAAQGGCFQQEGKAVWRLVRESARDTLTCSQGPPCQRWHFSRLDNQGLPVRPVVQSRTAVLMWQASAQSTARLTLTPHSPRFHPTFDQKTSQEGLWDKTKPMALKYNLSRLR